jgi:hypothetical protein
LCTNRRTSGHEAFAGRESGDVFRYSKTHPDDELVIFPRRVFPAGRRLFLNGARLRHGELAGEQATTRSPQQAFAISMGTTLSESLLYRRR